MTKIAIPLEEGKPKNHIIMDFINNEIKVEFNSALLLLDLPSGWIINDGDSIQGFKLLEKDSKSFSNIAKFLSSKGFKVSFKEDVSGPSQKQSTFLYAYFENKKDALLSQIINLLLNCPIDLLNPIYVFIERGLKVPLVVDGNILVI